MDWLRLYSDLLDNCVIQKLPDASFKAWINALCTASKISSKNGNIGTLSDVSFAFHETEETVSSAFHPLINLGIIETVNETFHETFRIKNWSKRQYKSDSSTERVRKYRKRKNTKMKQKGNVSVTAPDTDTDTDTEKLASYRKNCGKINSSISSWKQEKIPDSWLAIGTDRGIHEDLVVHSWRRFIDHMDANDGWPYQLTRWIGWIERERGE